MLEMQRFGASCNSLKVTRASISWERCCSVCMKLLAIIELVKIHCIARFLRLAHGVACSLNANISLLLVLHCVPKKNVAVHLTS